MFLRIALYGILTLALLSGSMLFLMQTSFPALEALVHNAHTADYGETVTAEAWGIFDPETGMVIEGRDIDTPYEIASVTKLFTAYVAQRSEVKGRQFTMTMSDIETDGRAGKLEVGEVTTPEALLFPLLIESSNDAGEAIRRALGTEWRSALETLFEKLSLVDTVIADGSGLDARNRSTVHDLARYYAFIKKEEPYIIDITRIKMYITDTNGYVNNDPAREFVEFSGGKNGYTESAGRTFVGTFRVQNTQKEIGIVLLKSTDLRADLGTLLKQVKNGNL